MLKSKTFLTADFGAGSLKLAEFEVNEAGGLRLRQFGRRPLGPEGAQDTKREAAVKKALAELLTEKGIRAKAINVCAPGYHVFSKFVKLPAVESAKVTQMIQYEAQQNVPFPLAEVVWDYQILGTTAAGEMEVLLVAIKTDVVEGIFRTVDASGLSLQVADVSAAALTNAFRYNYGDVEECCMLLDIGAKTSNVLFFEKGKVFARSINIGANSITQDFVNETKTPWPAAEEFKVKEGFVSLGGAYEEPESPRQAALSKIARQFMTRLHIQVNQTMQFYRGQQGGSAPTRLYLAGGASILTYTAQFFAEKLNVPVEYFNPLRNVEIDPALNVEELARVAHALGETVGLGLRNLAHCPIELNLMPRSTRRLQSFQQKRPYLVATAACLAVVILAIGYLYQRLAAVKQAKLSDIAPILLHEEEQATRYRELKAALDTAQGEYTNLVTWIEDRWFWADALRELHRVLQNTEKGVRSIRGMDVGLWVEKFTTTSPLALLDGTQAAGITADPGASSSASGRLGMGYESMSPELRERFMRRYGLGPGGRGEHAAPPTPPANPDPAAAPAEPAAASTDASTASTDGTGAAAAAAPSNTNEIASVDLVLRAVSLGDADNKLLPFAFIKELQANRLTAPEEAPPKDAAAGQPKESATRLVGEIEQSETGTFSFRVKWKLQRPIKLQ